MTEAAPENPLWLHILTISRPMREVDFPRRDPVDGTKVCKLLMRVLSVAELQDAALNAFIETRKRDDAQMLTVGSEAWNAVFNNESSLQLIYRACREDSDNPKERGVMPFFPPPNMLRKELTDDEISILLREYEVTTMEFGVMKRAVSNEEADEVLRAVVDDNSAEPLTEYSWSALTAIVMRAADRLAMEPAQ